MITVTRRLEFDYGHRVLGHEGKCKHLHGHRGVAEVTVKGPRLDEVGRVVDFGEVRRLVGGWVDDHWDHNLLLNPADPLLCVVGFGDHHGREAFEMPVGNPTAENMAECLYHIASSLLFPKGLTVVKVRMWETPSCYADYEPSPA